MDSNQLSTILLQTLHPATQKQAESQLIAGESDPDLAYKLINLLYNTEIDISIKLAAVLYLKNYIKKVWPLDEESSILSKDKRDALKSKLIDIMIETNATIQVHLSEIISIIASYDFPNNWADLLPSLVSKLSTNDYHINNGVLKTVHAIFKKYRYEFRSDRLFLEIKYVLEQFAKPLLELYKNTDIYIDSHGQDKEALNILFNSLFLLNKVFYSLSSQDIPEFFEDHLQEFMTILKKYLTYANSLLATSSDEESGLIEKVQTSICEIVHLYAQRYDEEFIMLSSFVDTILNLLSSTSLAPKYDLLISNALGVITVVAKRPQYSSFFEESEILKVICEKIIIPNIQMRESDEEMFEYEPLDFVRHDIEGSETDSRRKAAEDLIRSIVNLHGNRINPILNLYINACFKEYMHSPKDNWKKKDAGIYVFMAIAIKTFTITKGATSVHGFVSILDFYNQNILPDLSSSNTSSIHPVLLSDAIKFCIIFRIQLSKEHLFSLFPLMIHFLAHPNVAVHTYASIFFDRALGIKIDSQPLIDASEWIPLCEPISARILTLLKPEKQPRKINENEYLMKTALRMILTLKSDIMPISLLYFQELSIILGEVAKNPTNPKFNHYAFEAFASLLKFAYSQKSLQEQSLIESILFPVTQFILQNDVSDFIPYWFTILSLFIEHSKALEVPASISFIFEPLLQPGLWLNHSNIPSLTRFLESYICKNPNIIIENNNHLNGVLGVFQNLLSIKMHDHYGFELLRIIFMHTPLSILASYLQQIMVQILTRAQGNKSIKFTKGFFLFICHFICFVIPSQNSDAIFIQLLESIQPGLFSMVVEPYILAENLTAVDERERKLISSAFIKLLGSIEVFDKYSNIWQKLLDKFVTIQSSVSRSSYAIVNEADLLDLEENSPGSVSVSSYSRLRTVTTDFAYSRIDELKDSQIWLLETIISLKSSRQGVLNVLSTAPPLTIEYLKLISTKMSLDIFA